MRAEMNLKGVFNKLFALLRAGGTGTIHSGLEARCDARQEDLAPWLCLEALTGFLAGSALRRARSLRFWCSGLWTHDVGSR